MGNNIFISVFLTNPPWNSNLPWKKGYDFSRWDWWKKETSSWASSRGFSSLSPSQISILNFWPGLRLSPSFTPLMGRHASMPSPWDSWPASAPHQHFTIAVFRAVENPVFIARAANTGITGFIDPKGKIVRQGEIFTEEAMNGTIRLSKNKTFYTLYGDVIAWICSGFSLLLLGYAFLQKKSKKEWSLHRATSYHLD